MVERRRVRSDSYQFLLLEISCSSEMLSAFSNEEGVYKRLNPFAYNEDIADLEEQLKIEFWRIVNTMLTPRQRDVIRLSADGYTQQEIAKILNVNQSSITKSLNGNSSYTTTVKSYGGSKRKIQKIIVNDEKIKEILRKISELRDT
jgi:DNA-directed RNA polymerase specialized sigma subunit